MVKAGTEKPPLSPGGSGILAVDGKKRRKSGPPEPNRWVGPGTRSSTGAFTPVLPGPTRPGPRHFLSAASPFPQPWRQPRTSSPPSGPGAALFWFPRFYPIRL